MEALFLFAPGAGAPSSHPWMQRWKDRLATIGRVELFDYDYMREGRKRPDPLPQLVAAHRAALARARRDTAEPAILIGKSMGGRIGCHVALEEEVTGIVCLGYPLCGGGNPAKLRDQVLLELQTPVLFVQGSRDNLCPPEMLENVRSQMRASNSLHVVEDGDHSLMVSKRHLGNAGETQDDVDRRIMETISQFAQGIPAAT